jgi:hypothetical protein
MKKKNEILKTERDKKIFFDAILNDSKPNDKLVEAFKKYDEYVKKDK